MLLALFLPALAADDAPLAFGLSFQPRVTATFAGDPDAPDADALSDTGFRVRRMLLTAQGTLADRVDVRFRVDAARAFTFTDADGKAQQATKPLLDDAQVVVRLAEPLALSLGQWKVPFTSSQAMSDTALLFPDRPLPVDGFKLGDTRLTGFTWSRDIGAAALGSVADKRLEYAVGVFGGDGANVWPPTDDGALVVARVQAAPLGAFAYDEVDLGRGAPRLALGASVARNTRPTYDGEGARDSADTDLRAGAELRFAARGLSFGGEALYGTATPAGGDPVESFGAYAQVGFALPQGVAFGARWAHLDPSLDADADAVTQIEGVVDAYLPRPGGGDFGHKAQLQLAWTTSLLDGSATPLAHQAQLAVAVAL